MRERSPNFSCGGWVSTASCNTCLENGVSCLVSGWHPSALGDELGGALIDLGAGGGNIVLW